MKKIVKVINDTITEHPELGEKAELPKVEGDLPAVFAKLGVSEYDFQKEPEIYDVSDEPEIVRIRGFLDEAIARAESLPKGSDEAK